MRITMIGSGNVATHFAAAFKNAGHRIVQVYSRDIHHAEFLAYHVSAAAINDLGLIDAGTDLFVIAVKDDAIAEVTKTLAEHRVLTVHTSGTTEIEAIAMYNNKAGVLYPLQTFSKNKEVDFSTVPLCIEGADETITKQLEQLAQTISNKVYRVSSAKRRVLHLAAVFACNFPNYLFAVAQDILSKSDLPFDMLRPLITETARKVQEQLPADVQTGPAIRNDGTTMAAHLQMLEGEPSLKLIYGLLSQEIIKNGKANHSTA